MSQVYDNKYPMQPPYEDEVVFFEGTTLRQNPQGLARKAKICPICNYPIHIRMVSKPCQHYFCYECYCKNTFACGCCGSLNSTIERIDDHQGMYTCDVYCQKVFSSEEQLSVHLTNHKLLQQ